METKQEDQEEEQRGISYIFNAFPLPHTVE